MKVKCGYEWRSNGKNHECGQLVEVPQYGNSAKARSAACRQRYERHRCYFRSCKTTA